MIVCIGWGSLIWCQKSLPIAGAWQADGPKLPVEFARQSRDGRITLVICDGFPVLDVLWAPLNVDTLDEAKRALASREGIKDHNIQYSIGFWSQTDMSNHKVAPTIGLWANARGVEAVVWTALKPKIGSETRVPSEEEVIAHLNALNGSARDAAEEYVRFAPRQIETKYRAAMKSALGWTPSGLL